LCATITSESPVCKIKCIHDNAELYIFEIVAISEKDKAPFKYDPYSNLKVNVILKWSGYFPGMAIERRAYGWTTFCLTQKKDYKFKLGYQPTPKELKSYY